ncbi:MAG: restriction endonuclease subunit S, partial [Chitinivibrionales bacterium]
MSKWSIKPLGEVCEILDSKRKPITQKDRIFGKYPYYGATGVLDYVHDYIFDERLILIGEDGAKWGAGEKTAFIAEGKYWVNNHAHVIKPNRKTVIDKWIVYFINSEDLSKYVTGVTVPKLNQANLREIPIPLPPLPEQERIVKLLDEADELRKLRGQADKRSAKLIPALFEEMFGDPEKNPKRFPIQQLCSICNILGGGTPSKKRHDYWQGKIPWVSPKDMYDLVVKNSEDHISETALKESATNLIPIDSILIVTRSGVLKHTLPVAINAVPVTINQDIKAFVPQDGCVAAFLAAQIRILAPKILGMVRVGATVQNLE